MRDYFYHVVPRFPPASGSLLLPGALGLPRLNRTSSTLFGYLSLELTRARPLIFGLSETFFFGYTFFGLRAMTFRYLNFSLIQIFEGFCCMTIVSSASSQIH